MLYDTGTLLKCAKNHGFAIGAFNIYNLEGATAAVQAAEEMSSPILLQLLPSAIGIGGPPLIAMCLKLAEVSTVPVSVHLDHCSDENMIMSVLQAGLTSVMADGSSLDYQKNIEFTDKIVQAAAPYNGFVEAELGKLSGQEDGITILEREAKYTDPGQAEDFARQTGISALAVCIGNSHGKYHRTPELDFARLNNICDQVPLPIVLHGTSGLPDQMIQEAISYGICKFNVNTEIRSIYLEFMKKSFASSLKPELVSLMKDAISVMKEVVKSKLQLFCSANKAVVVTTEKKQDTGE